MEKARQTQKILVAILSGVFSSLLFSPIHNPIDRISAGLLGSIAIYWIASRFNLRIKL